MNRLRGLSGSIGTCYGDPELCRGIHLGSVVYVLTKEREVGRSQTV